MKRRNFIKISTVGSAFLTTSGIWNLNKTLAANPENIKYCFQSERKIPVVYRVDVVVIGGSTAGVAAAIAASDEGASVFLAAQEPYLGEDVCGTFRLWNGDTQTDLGQKIFGNGQPTPMFVKRILPKGLEGIAVTGLGASAHRDAMPVIRMQPCLQNQGFAVGIAAAMAAANNQRIRYIDIKALQQKLVKIESMPERVLIDQDNYPPSFKEVQKASMTLVDDLAGLEIVMWNKELGIPALVYQLNLSLKEEDKLAYARILGMLDNNSGWKILRKRIDGFEQWDKGWNYTGMGQFGMSMSYLDSLIIALGKTREKGVLPSIIRLAEMLTPESDFSHFRAVAVAFENLASEVPAKTLFELLQMKGVTGHAMTNICKAIRDTPVSRTDTSTRNNALREIILGRSLYKCGDYNGLGTQILNEYAKDLRGHFYRHASGVLKLGMGPKEKKLYS